MTPKEYDITAFESLNIQEEILKHGLIVFKGNRSLDVKDYEQMSTRLGKLVHTKNHVLNKNNTIQIVSETDLFIDGDVEWHNDWSYGRGNYFGTMLYNKLNGEKSTTDFVDMKDAYQTYPNKQELEDQEGTYFPPDAYNYCFTEQQKRILEKRKQTRKFAHTHHITGDKVLYFSPGSLQTDIDVSHLITHCEKNIYEHQWEPNDVLLYDNIRVMHRRHAFTGSRTLWRVQFWI